MPFGLTNAPAVFQTLMQQVLSGLNPEEGPEFVLVYIDDILVVSHTLDDHLLHLQLVLERLTATGLKLKPSKCHFVRRDVEYLGHRVTPEGLRTNTRLVGAVQEFPRPQNVGEVCRFLGLASYYRRFISQFASIAQPLHALTRKEAPFDWSDSCEKAMETLQHKLTTAPVLTYPSGGRPYTLETDASILGLGAVLNQEQDNGKLHPIAYASRSLSASERNYGITELETLAVAWAISHFHCYVYGQEVAVVTDHSVVKAVLETPNPSDKHARWWTKVYETGVRSVRIIYRAGHLNLSADALLRCPRNATPDTTRPEAQVAVVQSGVVEDSPIDALLKMLPRDSAIARSFAEEQAQDPELKEIVSFLGTGELPAEEKHTRRLALQQSLFTLEDGVLFYVDPKQEHRKRVAVPSYLRSQILAENHSSAVGGHFAGKRMYGALVRHWWWDGMYRHPPVCPPVSRLRSGHRSCQAPLPPPLHPIPVSRPFQIVGVDIMEFPKTEDGNRYVLVFQDFLMKWPLVFPMPDQKADRIAKLLVREVVPFFGGPEALLSDRGPTSCRT